MTLQFAHDLIEDLYAFKLSFLRASIDLCISRNEDDRHITKDVTIFSVYLWIFFEIGVDIVVSVVELIIDCSDFIAQCSFEFSSDRWVVDKAVLCYFTKAQILH